MHRFEIEEPSTLDIEFFEERLSELNVARTGIGDGQSLGVFLRDACKPGLLREARPTSSGGGRLPHDPFANIPAPRTLSRTRYTPVCAVRYRVL